MAVDPVCGMQVDEQRPAATAEHAGQRYYFCRTGCRDRFVADPAKYLGPQPSLLSIEEPSPPAAACCHGAGDHSMPVARTDVPAGAKYTCPMHPEVLSDKPGDCPLCGMPLVPIAGSGETDDSELHDLQRRLLIGIALSVPLAIIAM